MFACTYERESRDMWWPLVDCAVKCCKGYATTGRRRGGRHKNDVDYFSHNGCRRVATTCDFQTIDDSVFSDCNVKYTSTCGLFFVARS